MDKVVEMSTQGIRFTKEKMEDSDGSSPKKPEDGTIVSTKFTDYGYIKRKKVEVILSIIAERLNVHITSVWLSDDGDKVCDLREFVLNIFTLRPKEVISALKEASFLEHLNGQCRHNDIFRSSANKFKVITDPATQEIKDVMNDEKRSLRSYLLGKNLNNGQILSLFSDIDAGMKSEKIIDHIKKLGNVTLSRSKLPYWMKAGDSWWLNFKVAKSLMEDTSEVTNTFVENNSVEVPIVNCERYYGVSRSFKEGYPCSTSGAGCNGDITLAQTDINGYEGSCSGAGNYEGLRSGGESYGCKGSGVEGNLDSSCGGVDYGGLSYGGGNNGGSSYGCTGTGVQGNLDSSCGRVDYGGLSYGGGNYGGSSNYTGDFGGSCSGGGDFGGFDGL